MKNMTLDEFSVLVKAMKAVYADPKFLADEYAVETWYSMLCDLPYPELSYALKAHMQTDPFPPTIAGLRSQVSKAKTQPMTELEAWAIVRTAVGRSGYYWQEEFEKLPKTIQKAVGRAENLKEWATTDLSELETVIQSQFLRSFRVAAKREEEVSRMSPDMIQRLCGETAAKLTGESGRLIK